MEVVVEELHDALESACRSCLRLLRTTKKLLPRKSVPWRTETHTVLREKVNAQRRRYQLTRGDNALRDQRKEQYLDTKAEYAATTRKKEALRGRSFLI